LFYTTGNIERQLAGDAGTTEGPVLGYLPALGVIQVTIAIAAHGEFRILVEVGVDIDTQTCSSQTYCENKVKALVDDAFLPNDVEAGEACGCENRADFFGNICWIAAISLAATLLDARQ
jgi:hypothetical protein